MADGLENLLRPVLTRDDDLARFGRPFRPASLVFATFFGGPFCAALLFGWNWSELGQRKRSPLTVAGFVALGLILPFAFAGLVQAEVFDLADQQAGRAHRLLGRAIALVPALLLARAQAARYRIYEGAGGEPRPALWPGLGAILLGAFASILTNMAALALFGIELER